jgi:hypothetical protein
MEVVEERSFNSGASSGSLSDSHGWPPSISSTSPKLVAVVWDERPDRDAESDRRLVEALAMADVKELAALG